MEEDLCFGKMVLKKKKKISLFYQDDYCTRPITIVRNLGGRWHRHLCRRNKSSAYAHHVRSPGQIQTPDPRRFVSATVDDWVCRLALSAGPRGSLFVCPSAVVYASSRKYCNVCVSSRACPTIEKKSGKKNEKRKTEKSHKDTVRLGDANRRFASQTIFDPCLRADGRKSRILLCIILYEQRVTRERPTHK